MTYNGESESNDPMLIDFNWFKENLKQLFEQYGNAFLAIKNKKVIGVYNSFSEGVNETEKTEPLGTFIIQKCGPDESAYTVYVSSIFPRQRTIYA